MVLRELRRHVPYSCSYCAATALFALQLDDSAIMEKASGPAGSSTPTQIYRRALVTKSTQVFTSTLAHTVQEQKEPAYHIPMGCHCSRAHKHATRDYSPHSTP